LTSWRIERFDTLNSTSDLCVARAKEGESADLVVSAAQQTGGRGRGGHSWLSPPGNLYVSVLLRPDASAASSGLWSLLAGLVLAETLQHFLPPASRIGLKWPNDVLIADAKLGGVLIDAAIEQGRFSWLVIGFGANLAHAPEVPGRKVTFLAAHDGAAAPDLVIRTLLTRLDHWRGDVEAANAASGNGAALRAAWLARAHPEGSPISVDDGRIAGRFAGIAPDGALLLARDAHIETIRAGEISIGENQ
jgi:BirA family biotin operon repressor/biotin-[acetyl-CoA-carboxylase] ligase